MFLVGGTRALAAPADVTALRVELAAPAACPAEPSLLARVQRHTTRVREAKEGDVARVLALGIAARGDGFVGDLRLLDPGDELDPGGELERTIPGKTCEEVLAAAALIAALTIDPHASATPAPSAEPTDAGAEIADARWPPRARRPPAPPAPSEARRRPPRPAARLRASLGASLEVYDLAGLVPGRAVWVEGSVTRGLEPALRLRLGQLRSFSVVSDARPAFFELGTLALEGCVTALAAGGRRRSLGGRRPFDLRPCVQATGGVFEGASSAFSATREPRPWLAVGGFVQGRWRFFGPLALEAALGFTAPLVRDDFYFRPRALVYRAPEALLVGSVGVGVTFR
ncbi:MAG: hypothetical protein KF850_04525 [Labilithrix sp.]|nr:hypothetical protein [Labilithrix sp.]